MADNKEKQCTVIVSYEVANEDADRFLDSWEKANEFLRKQPGFVSTALHRAVSANPDFRFVNVSCWESDDAFRAATQSQDFRDASGRLLPFPIHASAYEIVRT
jgi:heme oxygenase (mycobilin-producing)